MTSLRHPRSFSLFNLNEQFSFVQINYFFILLTEIKSGREGKNSVKISRLSVVKQFKFTAMIDAKNVNSEHKKKQESFLPISHCINFLC